MAFDTQLTPQEEQQFQQWKAIYAPRDSGVDYDLRGAFKAGLRPDPKSGHWPDTYKKPNHPTFSNQSIYAKDAPEKAGSWNGETYMPPRGMLPNFNMQDAASALGRGLLAQSQGQPLDIGRILMMTNLFREQPEQSQAEPFQGTNPGYQLPVMGNMPVNDAVARLMKSIGHLESHGNYGEIGPVTRRGDRAYGKYQVMGENIPSWTREATGRSITPAEFLANPEIQDQVARHFMTQYYNKYGNPSDVASVWFSGRPAKGNTSRDVLGTTVPQYVAEINRNF